VRRGGLEALAKDTLAGGEHRVLDRFCIPVVPRHGHLEVVEHVVVGLSGSLQSPGLARGESIEGQLDVVL
jgi:hypothetical protein